MINRLLLILLLIVAIPASANGLEVADAWIKDLPMVVPVRAGYLKLTNRQATSITITGLKSEAFASIEIHQSIEKESVASMRSVAELVIAAGVTVELKPGGYHLMMINPGQKLEPGSSVLVTIQYADQSTQDIEMMIRK